MFRSTRFSISAIAVSILSALALVAAANQADIARNAQVLTRMFERRRFSRDTIDQKSVGRDRLDRGATDVPQRSFHFSFCRNTSK